MSAPEHMQQIKERDFPWMNDAQFECFMMLCDLFYGFHHVRGKIKECGRDGILINTRSANCFATFDFNNLTRAVVMAHDRLIRFAIEPSGPGMLQLTLHKRQAREGEFYARHPTIESHIESIRSERYE